MPTTRSTTRAASGKAQVQMQEIPGQVNNIKRKAAAPETTALKKPRVTKAKPPSIPPPVAATAAENVTEEDEVVPAVLTFSFEDAKKHLIKLDRRFEDLFEKMPCKPFEELEQVHPFRSLATSILGQQISWMAARSIKHKFIRLYDQSIPELYSDYNGDFFPTPRQVATTDLALLRTAGLSGRKAEYVQDLAARFSDGRLSTVKLLKASDEELAEMLIAVKGIGPWTVDMFAIFSLRRPNILPIGDLGVQRGVMRWFLSLHSPTYNVTISPEKQKKVPAKRVLKKKTKDVELSDEEEDDVLPTLAKSSKTTSTTLNDVSAVPHAPLGNPEDPVLPPTMTPSVNKILNQAEKETKSVPAPLPAGLTISSMKTRMDGKKKIKGALLTPKEMEELTEGWKPYRSVAVYYMWSLADVEES